MNPAWTSQDLATNPHDAADKARRVEQMFAAIAPSYDLNNRLHSLWRDQAWRRAAVKAAELKATDTVVDVACGTGDLTMLFATWLCLKHIEQRDWPRPKRAQVMGIDFTPRMLEFAVAKSKRVENDTMPGDDSEPLWPGLVEWSAGDAMALPLPDACCDVVSIAFGIRNVAVPEKAVAEFFRILRPGGRLIILEFSLPKNPVFRGLYNYYFKHIMPRTATLIARDRSGAYRYLPRSVNTFIDRPRLVGMMTDAGFNDVTTKALTFGIAVVYKGIKH